MHKPKMKSKLLLTLGLLGSTTIFAQTSIPNGSFENWESKIITFPKNYAVTSNTEKRSKYIPQNCERTSDAFHGNSAIKLTTIEFEGEINLGYFVNFAPDKDPNTWHGGQPITETPKGVKGYYKSDVKIGDSAFILATFSKNGINIGSYFYFIVGQKNSYTSFNFTFNPPLTQTPDSMIFGAVSSNAINETGLEGSMLILDSVSIVGVNTQPSWLNGDFENWDSLNFQSPISWYQDIDRLTISTKTTSAYKGSAAVKLESKINEKDNGNSKTERESIGTAYYPDSCWGCHAIGGYPFTNQFDTLIFWYKYLPQGGAKAEFRFDIKKNGMFVGGNQLFLEASSTYKKIEIPMLSDNTPDTLQIFIQSSRWEDSLLTNAGSILYIDEIQLKSAPLKTGIKTNWFNNEVKCYPNPANDIFNIVIPTIKSQDNVIIRLVNILGQIELKQKINSNNSTIMIEHLRQGIYYYKIEINGMIAKSGQLMKQ